MKQLTLLVLCILISACDNTADNPNSSVTIELPPASNNVIEGDNVAGADDGFNTGDEQVN